MPPPVLAGAEAVGEEVRLWYGSRAAPCLVLPPISLRDFLQSGARDEDAGSR